MKRKKVKKKLKKIIRELDNMPPDEIARALAVIAKDVDPAHYWR